MIQPLLILSLVSSTTAFIPITIQRYQSHGLNKPTNRKCVQYIKMFSSGGNSLGDMFRISTWGESHGGGVGVTIDGCPPRVAVSLQDIQSELDRRRPGQSYLTTSRKELDQVEILSGIADGITLGTPIALLVRNTDGRSRDYKDMEVKYRPSHADFTYDMKYGVRAVAGGGRASARETLARVAAGAVAKQVLRVVEPDIEILSYVQSIHNIEADSIDRNMVMRQDIDVSLVRCPQVDKSIEMIKLIEVMMKEGDSLGGKIECIVRGLRAGIGSPVFHKLEAKLAMACMSIPAAKAFEVGSGFAGTKMLGSEHNDPFEMTEGARGYSDEKKVRTTSNRSGGIQGGISNGEMIVMRVGFKPTSTIRKPQNTVTRNGENTILQAKGRHDACVLPRAAPIVEAMVALTLLDEFMIQHAQCGLSL